MSSLKIPKSFRIPTNAQSFLLPSSLCPNLGYRISGKEVEVHGSGSWHHQLCHHRDLQLIQNHVAPSCGPPARLLSPLFFQAKSLLLPRPCGKRELPKPHSPNPAWLWCLGLNPSANLPLRPISNSSHNHLHLPAFPYSSSFTQLPQ
ncbi:hypothetical protein HJG60_008898 [Phyllostomus discolor]|uniref:Uncharacterized protein n=1 Tax=Phyllostomus discolor TaxID=89673 RepID=A0A833YTM7_9CHIR|nr:hypothetical protein HJG60_008898 [Phyllostomus discolor]